MEDRFTAHGKLLLTGEYLVLDGALALAVPTRPGQQLHVWPYGEEDVLYWRSLGRTGKTWFTGRWRIGAYTLVRLEASDAATAGRLEQILLAAVAQGVELSAAVAGRAVETYLDFSREWGLGTSSTLLYLLARWLGVNEYRLLADTFGGSGYDLACAGAHGPLLYRLVDGQPQVKELNWHPPYAACLHFVHLGRKQDSREGIHHYRRQPASSAAIGEVSALTEAFLQASDVESATDILRRHEVLISQTLDLPTVQDRQFPDFPGGVKSLGAWGGDFVMTVSDLSRSETTAYFNEKGFYVVIPYEEMVFGERESGRMGEEGRGGQEDHV